jgi:hypothetical protein
MYTPTHQAIVNVCYERIAELEAREKALQEKLETKASAPKSEPVEEKSEAEAVDSVNVETPQTETLDDFVRRVRNRFILTSQPICNSVEGWQKETTFYINSYGKLSLTTQNGNFSQLNDPILIHKFWKWLMSHQERIGDIVEFKRVHIDIKALNQKYSNSKIKIDGKIRWIERIIDMGSGLNLTIRDDKGKSFVVLDGLGKPRVYGYEVFGV